MVLATVPRPYVDREVMVLVDVYTKEVDMEVMDSADVYRKEINTSKEIMFWLLYSRCK